MKYTQFKTAALMLSASALLVLSGCDGSAGTASNSGIGEVPVVVPPVDGNVTPPPSPVEVTKLYGTTGFSSGVSSFVELNVTTGEIIETIGSIGYLVNGLEYDATMDTFFATTSANDATCASCLITIDPATGAGTEIGSSGFGVILNPTVNSAGEMYGWTEDSDQLVSINKTTGEATLIDGTGANSWSHGLAFNAEDQLFLYNGDDAVYEMNTTTGDSTFYVDINDSDYAHHGDFDLYTGVYAGINSTGSARSVVFKDGTTFETISTSEHNYTNLHTLTFVNSVVAP